MKYVLSSIFISNEYEFELKHDSILTRRLESIPLISNESYQIDECDSYLVTGGLGFVGRIFIGYLQEHGAKNIIALSN